MLRVRLGRSGPSVPPVAIGAWQLGGRLWGRVDRRVVEEVVEAAAGHSLLFFDTAELYGAGRSERLLGEALRAKGLLEEAIIVTKVAGYRVTARGVIGALEASRRRLGRSPDIVLYHWPPPHPWKTCRAVRLLEEAADRGLTGYIGVSNFNACQLVEAVYCTRKHEIVVDQVHYSLAHRVPENCLEPVARRHGVALMAWGPLAKGALAKGRRKLNAARLLDPVYREAVRDRELQQALSMAAEELGVSRAVVAVAWLRSHGAIPVVGSRKRRHVEDAAKAASLKLPQEVLAELDRASEKYRSRWGLCYHELHWNRLIPPPIQALLYRYALRGI